MVYILTFEKTHPSSSTWFFHIQQYSIFPYLSIIPTKIIKQNWNAIKTEIKKNLNSPNNFNTTKCSIYIWAFKKKDQKLRLIIHLSIQFALLVVFIVNFLWLIFNFNFPMDENFIWNGWFLIKKKDLLESFD